MAKGTSFAEKSKRGDKKDKDFTVVKYVKSVESEKTGGTRFQESILKVPAGKSLDAYLKELEAEPVVEEESQAETEEAATEEEATAEVAENAEASESSESEPVEADTTDEKENS